MNTGNILVNKSTATTMKLYFREQGKGWPMIIVHGLYGSSDNWLTIAKQLESHFKIFTVDLRNHGNSPHSNEHSYKAMATDLDEFIESNGILNPILLGHSMGGKVVMQYGLSHPEKVHRMVVVDISPLSNTSAHHKQHTIDHSNIISALRNLPIERIESRKEADTILSERVPSERTRSFLLKNLTRSGNTFKWKLNLDALATNLEEVMDGFSTSTPQHINQKSFPILFIKGSQSDYIDKRDEEAIKIFYPEAKIAVVENAGHWVHAEQPQALTNLLLTFCKEESDFM